MSTCYLCSMWQRSMLGNLERLTELAHMISSWEEELSWEEEWADSQGRLERSLNGYRSHRANAHKPPYSNTGAKLPLGQVDNDNQ